MPTGPILPGGGGIESAPVSNRHSVWSDHTTYWDNDEEFVTAVSRAVAPLIPIDLEPASKDTETIENSRERRRWRVRWLSFTRTLTLCSVILAIWVFNRLELLGGFAATLTGAIRSNWPNLLGDPSKGPSWLWEASGSPWGAAFIVVLLHVFWYLFVISSVWSAWDHRETRRFFERQNVDLGGGYFVAVISLAVLPLVAVTTLLWVGGPAPIVDAISWLGYVPRTIWFALVVSVFVALGMAGTTFVFAKFFAKGKRETWLSENWIAGLALCAVVAFLTVVPGMLWLAVNYPEWLVAEPGTFSWKAQLARVGLGFTGFSIVSGLAGLLVAKLALTGSRWQRMAKRRAIVKEWLVEHFWAASWDTDPDTAHPVRISATIACAAAVISVATGFLIYRGWQTWPAALLLVIAFLIAVMMGWNTSHRAEEEMDSLANLLGRLSFWLAIASFCVPSIVREYWPQ